MYYGMDGCTHSTSLKMPHGHGDFHRAVYRKHMLYDESEAWAMNVNSILSLPLTLELQLYRVHVSCMYALSSALVLDVF